MSSTPLYFESATSLALKIRRKEVTSRQLTEMFIRRIEDMDGRINAVVVRCFEQARQRAAELDRQLASGEVSGPLHGVPITVKENNDVEGLPTTIGDPTKKGAPAASTYSPAVQRLVDAGAVIMGKTNLPIGCNDVQSYNAVYGTTSNPFDLSRTPGGSSGGSAAAICAGFSALELGGDIGGSIRVPAACCGIFGHKSTLGAIPFSSGPSSSLDIVVKGPLARTAEDLVVAMQTLVHVAGPAKRAWTLTLPPCEKSELKQFRVAIWADDACCPVDSDMRVAVQRVVSTLRKAGCSAVVEAAHPLQEKWGWEGGPARAFEVYKCLLATEENKGVGAEEATAMRSRHRADEGEVGGGSTSSRAQRLRQQTEWITQSTQSWHAANAERQKMRLAYERFFSEFDVLVCPICASVAWPKDERGAGSHEWTKPPVAAEGEYVQHFWQINDRIIPGADGHQTPYHDQVFWSGVTNICGNPATTFPAGRAASKEGNNMPVGLQVVGAEWGDLTTLAFVSALEREAGYVFVPPEGYETSENSTVIAGRSPSKPPSRL